MLLRSISPPRVLFVIVRYLKSACSAPIAIINAAISQIFCARASRPPTRSIRLVRIAGASSSLSPIILSIVALIIWGRSMSQAATRKEAAMLTTKNLFEPKSSPQSSLALLRVLPLSLFSFCSSIKCPQGVFHSIIPRRLQKSNKPFVVPHGKS